MSLKKAVRLDKKLDRFDKKISKINEWLESEKRLKKRFMNLKKIVEKELMKEIKGLSTEDNMMFGLIRGYDKIE